MFILKEEVSRYVNHIYVHPTQILRFDGDSPNQDLNYDTIFFIGSAGIVHRKIFGAKRASSDDDEMGDDLKSQNSSMDNDMTKLVKSQSSNGMFEISDERWKASVFNTYLGNFQDVKASCPENTELNTWLTALAMKILEVQMIQNKDLWELVAEKSNKYLLKQLLNNEEEYNKLQEKAEAFVLKRKN